MQPCAVIIPSAKELQQCGAIVDSDHGRIDLTSIDDLIKRCSARLYLQRCCAADRGGMDLYSSVDLFVDIEFCSGADPSALMIFAAVCSGLQQVAVVRIYSLTSIFTAM